MVSRVFWILIVWLGTFGSGSATESKRFALLIGNKAYDVSVGQLANPHNDVARISAALKARDFEVAEVRDAKRSALLASVRDFARKLKAAGSGAVGFLYYSGHGAAEKDTNINYIIPVDASEPGSMAFWDASVKLDDIVQLLQQAPAAVKFVVFDACRNELRVPTKDTSKGLLPIAEQQGYFIAYASAPGRTASDRGQGSGPYAAALASELGRAGLDHLNLFQNVKENVIASTQGAQHPWESNGLSRRVYLTGEPTTEAEIALWEKVRGTNEVAALKGYLERFPTGLFASTARQMIKGLESNRDQAILDEPSTKGPFEGQWDGTYASKNCTGKQGPWRMRVKGESIEVFPPWKSISGVVGPDGTFKIDLTAKADGAKMTASGKLVNNEGSGTFKRLDGRCWGSFTMKRDG